MTSLPDLFTLLLKKFSERSEKGASPTHDQHMKRRAGQAQWGHLERVIQGTIK